MVLRYLETLNGFLLQYHGYKGVSPEAPIIYSMRGSNRKTLLIDKHGNHDGVVCHCLKWSILINFVIIFFASSEIISIT